jgi:hypothetical protein
LKQELKIENREQLTEKIIIENEDITNEKSIAVGFKNHFETCALKLYENVPNSKECNIIIDQQNEWQFRNVTEVEVVKSID